MEIIPTPIVVLLQLFPFGLTAIALYFIVFKPMLAYLDARAVAIEGERKQAAETEERLLARMAEYEGRLARARAEVADLRAARRETAAGEHAAIVALARGRAEQKVAAALREIVAEREVARATLEKTAGILGDQVASAVLGRDLAAG